MKNALLIVLAFALGGGIMWYVATERANSGAVAAGGPPAGRGPGGFAAPGGRQAQLPLVTVGRDPPASLGAVE